MKIQITESDQDLLPFYLKKKKSILKRNGMSAKAILVSVAYSPHGNQGEIFAVSLFFLAFTISDTSLPTCYFICY